MRKYSIFVSLIIGAFWLTEEFSLDYPDHFPSTVYDFDRNPLTKAKVDLGKALFYDPILSKDNTISCASCHSSFNAFAHSDHDLSHGINDQIGTRNAPALFNLAWQENFMWDGAVNNLDMQALAPITHAKEMNESLDSVLYKLEGKSMYRKLFYKAFQDSIITGEHLLLALSQFQLTLVSSSSKYDEVKQGKQEFTEQEEQGYSLFKKYCQDCHQEPIFTASEFAKNGLEVDSTLLDYGRFMVTERASDSLFYKIPSLRNLKYSYPYMHDGRFDKLREVLNHYGTGSTLQIGNERKNIKLSSREKTDLISFLQTLNDPVFIFDRQHQYPKHLFTNL
ncbi:cytochrome-c peroxidase [Saprospiraceae bacterium]|nr:cytochrome-c peroxidase [Saprospiraceae bacterium]